jgi:integrase/recombinase XerC
MKDCCMELIDHYVEWLRTCGRSSRTIGDRRDILTRIDKELPYGLTQATADELKVWLYRDGWSAATKETYYGAVASFFVWATSPLDPRLDYDPMQLLPRPATPRGLPRPVTDRQLEKILNEAADPYRTWALLACYAGLRCCEIAQLDREDITEEAITIRKGKGGKPGIVPTHPAIWVAVQDLPDGPIAHTDHGDPANARWVSIRTAIYFRRRLGMPGVALHRLRHWYGTTTYKATKDIRLTQELLRHSSPATTAIYTLVGGEERRRAVNSLPTFTGAPS